MLVAVLSGFALSLTAPWLHRISRGATGWLIALLPLALTLFFLSFAGPIAAGEVITASYEWVPSLGANLSFVLDGLSLLFVLLIAGIGTLIMVYAGGYLAGYQTIGQFYLFILAFMASMLGAVLTDNLIVLYVFWELTSLTSYLLIGFSHERPDSRASALQALLVTVTGGLAMLTGFVILGQVGNSYQISTLVERADLIQIHPLYSLALLLVLLAAFTKSAQFPFHFWLPNAMAAPTPVSAYLHSATMVKLGVYLLARFSPILGGTDLWIYTVTTVGAITTLVGGYLALTKTDLKQVLAYSTVSALGTLVMLIGLSTPEATVAMIVFLLAHALYKGALFMVAGSIDHEAGTRDVAELGGLYRAMPITAGIAAIAAVSLAGFGPVVSFIGKEMILEAILHTDGARPFLLVVMVVGSAFFVTAAAIVAIRPFFNGAQRAPETPHEAPVSMWLGPGLLAVLGLLLGLLPGVAGSMIVKPAAAAVLGEVEEPVKLALWHGFNTPLFLSIASVLAGLGLYGIWDRFRLASTRLEPVYRWGPARWYERLLTGLLIIGNRQTLLLQSGYLRYYIRTILVTTIILVGGSLASFSTYSWPPSILDIRIYELAIAVVMLLAALVALRADALLPSIIALGVVGYGASLIYLLFSAPDLAMTQFLVETLTVIVFVLVLDRLPNFVQRSGSRTRWLDAVIALGTGGLITALMLSTISHPADSLLSPFFAERSYLEAHGRNIVNVILVDFRAGDTMGEIVVLSAASIGIYALIKLRSGGEEKEES